MTSTAPWHRVELRESLSSDCGRPRRECPPPHAAMRRPFEHRGMRRLFFRWIERELHGAALAPPNPRAPRLTVGQDPHRPRIRRNSRRSDQHVGAPIASEARILPGSLPFADDGSPRLASASMSCMSVGGQDHTSRPCSRFRGSSTNSRNASFDTASSPMVVAVEETGLTDCARSADPISAAHALAERKLAQRACRAGDVIFSRSMISRSVRGVLFLRYAGRYREAS